MSGPLVLGWVTVRLYTVLHVTSHLGQLSLLPSEIWEISNGEGAVAVICGREGNRRSGVALAMGHKLCGIATYGISGLETGDEHPSYARDRSLPPTVTNHVTL